MKILKPASPPDWMAVIPETIPSGVENADREIFSAVTDVRLRPEQEERIAVPPKHQPRQRNVLAIHWHPEFVPMPLVARRLAAMYPNAETSLVIPTQHNVIVEHGRYAGVEIDCYARGFRQKVQLLLHFASDRLEGAGRLRAMLAHTFRYRSSQLFELIHSITRPNAGRLDEAARETGADEPLIRFVQGYTRKVKMLLEEQGDTLSPDMIKNKLLRNFFDGLRPVYGDALIDRSQTLIKAVKGTVKRQFPLRYFYRVSEVVEEARMLGAGIVVPHPEQFWPILLADYDVDGYEVWNPQSRQYTEFLIEVIRRKNSRSRGSRPLLIFMGDDTHMGEKTREPALQEPEKASREIGYQPAWEDMSVRKALIRADTGRQSVIEAYRERLDG